MKTNFTKSVLAAILALSIYGCSQPEEEMDSLEMSVTSEVGINPTTCNVVRVFGLVDNPKFVDEVEDGGVTMLVKGQRRGHNGKYLNENRATAFRPTRSYDNKTINLLGPPVLLTVGDGTSTTLHEGGGRLEIDFSPVKSVTMKSFVVYDINDADEGSKVELFSSTGQLLQSKPLPKTAEKDVVFVDFGKDIPGVARMVVTFGNERSLAGSGAISILQMCKEGLGRCMPVTSPLETIWMKYTGNTPANVEVRAKRGATSDIIFSEKGMKPGTIFLLENPQGLGEEVWIKTNRKETQTIPAAPGENYQYPVINKQYGSFQVVEARTTNGFYPVCLE